MLSIFLGIDLQDKMCPIFLDIDGGVQYTTQLDRPKTHTVCSTSED